jgi:hypothetical protein
VRLAEDHLPLLAVNGPPGPDAPLERAANTFGQFRMTPQHLIVNGNRTDAGGSREERNNLGLKDMLKRIGATPVARRLVLGWKPRFLLDAVSRRPTDRRLGGGDLNGVLLSVLHKEPRLMIGYMATRHKDDSPFQKTTNVPSRPRS